MKEITIWEIHEWDGGDRQHYHGNALSSQGAADVYLKNRPHDSVRKRTILVYDSLKDMDDNNSVKVRAAALAKLTEAEKQALGLKE